MATVRTPARSAWDADSLVATAYFTVQGNSGASGSFMQVKGFHWVIWFKMNGLYNAQGKKYMNEIRMFWAKTNVHREPSFHAACNYAQ